MVKSDTLCFLRNAKPFKLKTEVWVKITWKSNIYASLFFKFKVNDSFKCSGW